jgi:hypothetical protein
MSTLILVCALFFGASDRQKACPTCQPAAAGAHACACGQSCRCGPQNGSHATGGERKHAKRHHRKHH